ncbi:conserved hypothetical protein [Uncinocarpus reesii 1704]|uniref:Immediate-early protein n=1 Tax=Uncinocarpus reesii (strain UAMH 1704) TaxID=336963 RepID=C4JXE7_UNCRE|nr:uncharacterized protein UREG_06320 [Uncinocarpus reesii 1704]EEP81455.1 conserved hypothetical protein [Uncinocarpus reesii 1704]
MVTATRRSILSQPEDTPSRNGSPVANGKRKNSLAATEAVFEPTPKRRRGPSKEDSDSQASTPQPDGVPKKRYQVLKAVEIRTTSRSGTRESSIATPREPVNPEEISLASRPKPKTAHLRFDSEEPQPEPVEGQEPDLKQKDAEPQQQIDEDSDDDEAPEAVSNTKQLQELKEAERKREEATQRQEQLKKEKRREHEKRLKLQAKPKPTPLVHPSKPTTTPKQEDILSESSATLQGSEIRAPDYSSILPASLPKFLPDEILLAEPSIRPPTPPRETEKQPAALRPSGNKLRFLDTIEKKPKDVKLGSMSVRVLDGTGSAASKNSFHNALAPKASKNSRIVRENWMAGNRKGSAAVSGSLRRTTGGSSGFLRK